MLLSGAELGMERGYRLLFFSLVVVVIVVFSIADVFMISIRFCKFPIVLCTLLCVQ